MLGVAGVKLTPAHRVATGRGRMASERTFCRSDLASARTPSTHPLHAWTAAGPGKRSKVSESTPKLCRPPWHDTARPPGWVQIPAETVKARAALGTRTPRRDSHSWLSPQ